MTQLLGTKEWIGEAGKTFLSVRNTLENFLLNNDFSFYYFGLISKHSIYEDNIDVLGGDFLNNLIPLNKFNSDYILSPEGTFRVYDHLIKSGSISSNPKGKIFYSQEFVRNEEIDEVKKGKTFSFWQTGFEIYGYSQYESTWLSLATTIDSLNHLSIEDLYFRISDKRIFEELLGNLSLIERRYIYKAVDLCSENAEQFHQFFVSNGGNKDLATEITDFLKLSQEHNFTLEELAPYIKTKRAEDGILALNLIKDKVKEKYPKNPFKFISFMPKSWDACDTLLFDARIKGYPYAVAGGGSLNAMNHPAHCYKSGAGFGVTRLVDYLVNY